MTALTNFFDVWYDNATMMTAILKSMNKYDGKKNNKKSSFDIAENISDVSNNIYPRNVIIG